MPSSSSGGSLVTSANIVDNEIVNADINAAAAIDFSKLSGAAKAGDNTDITSLSFLKHISRVITSAEILAMRASPIEIIPLPGANKLLRVIEYSLAFRYGTVQYTGGGNVLLKWSTNQDLGLSYLTTAEVNAAADALKHGIPSPFTTSSCISFLNRGANLYNGGVAEFANGDGTIVVDVYYYIIDIDA